MFEANLAHFNWEILGISLWSGLADLYGMWQVWAEKQLQVAAAMSLCSLGMNRARFARKKKAPVVVISIPETNFLVILKAVSVSTVNTTPKAKVEKI